MITGKHPSTMTHSFAQVPKAQIERSSFDRSRSYKTTFDPGYLVPFFFDEVLPGDTFKVAATTFARLLTPIVPIMDNIWADVFYFFVPNRLVWTHWQQFNGEQANPGDSTSYLVPQTQCPAGGYLVGTLQDYFGLPTAGSTFGAGNQIYHNQLHLRAYNLIWNQWFRDENLQNSVTVDTGDGPDTYSNYVLLKRGKRHDYFTASLPWTQKGTAVTLPLGTRANVRGIGKFDQNFANGSQNIYETGGSALFNYPNSANIDFASGAHYQWTVEEDPNNAGFPNIYADLSTATSATINAIRQAFQIQRLYERDARGGTRYTEIVRSHFGVISPDARLQRPEYLGGGTTRVAINPIAQTSATGASGTTTPQGNLSASATFNHNNEGFNKSFTEHGVLIGLISVRADLNYQQGMHKMWNRQTRFDFFWPALAHLGEQAILNQEIYCVGNGASGDTEVFGYQERYAEYRYAPNLITGEFRSTYSAPLDIWHLAQKFTSLPTLGATFIQENPPISRVTAVSNEPQFQLDAWVKCITTRPMPTYGVPGMVDHF